MLCSLIDVSMHVCVCVCRCMGYCMCVYTQTNIHTHTHHRLYTGHTPIVHRGGHFGNKKITPFPAGNSLSRDGMTTSMPNALAPSSCSTRTLVTTPTGVPTPRSYDVLDVARPVKYARTCLTMHPLAHKPLAPSYPPSQTMFSLNTIRAGGGYVRLATSLIPPPLRFTPQPFIQHIPDPKAFHERM